MFVLILALDMMLFMHIIVKESGPTTIVSGFHELCRCRIHHVLGTAIRLCMYSNVDHNWIQITFSRSNAPYADM